MQRHRRALTSSFRNDKMNQSLLKLQVLDADESSESIWLNTSLLSDVTNDTDGFSWDTDSCDGEGNLGIPLDLIPQNVKRQLKGQEFLRRLKENLGDNEHGEVYVILFNLMVVSVDLKNSIFRLDFFPA